MMNKIILIPSLFVFLGMVSCQKKNSPEYVTKEFLTAVQKKDWDKAKSLGDEATKKHITFWEFMEENISDTATTDENWIKEIKDIKCEVKDSTATCFYCCVFEDQKSMINLVKKDGKWLISHGKESPASDLEMADDIDYELIETEETADTTDFTAKDSLIENQQ